MKKNCFILCLMVTALCSCISDADKEWGNSLLYMPQAVLADGGVTNNYPVTLSDNKADTAIVVGLYRSGLEVLQAVSVDLVVDTDSLEQAIAMSQLPDAAAKYDIYKNALLLPEEYYTVPRQIILQDGERENSVRLVIHKSALLNEAHLQEGNTYILPLRITNPTRYTINPKISLTMFVFRLASDN